MTAIAYRDGVMAADTLVTGADMVRGRCRKIVRSPVGVIAACAGEAGTSTMFRRWIEGGGVDDWINAGFGVERGFSPGVDRGGFGAILVLPDATVVCLDWRGRPIIMEAAFYTEGAAEQILTGAMAAGASAEEAVRIAIAYDCGCGGEVQVQRIG